MTGSAKGKGSRTHHDSEDDIEEEVRSDDFETLPAITTTNQRNEEEEKSGRRKSTQTEKSKCFNVSLGDVEASVADSRRSTQFDNNDLLHQLLMIRQDGENDAQQFGEFSPHDFLLKHQYGKVLTQDEENSTVFLRKLSAALRAKLARMSPDHDLFPPLSDKSDRDDTTSSSSSYSPKFTGRRQYPSAATGSPSTAHTTATSSMASSSTAKQTWSASLGSSETSAVEEASASLAPSALGQLTQLEELKEEEDSLLEVIS